MLSVGKSKDSVQKEMLAASATTTVNVERKHNRSRGRTFTWEFVPATSNPTPRCIIFNVLGECCTTSPVHETLFFFPARVYLSIVMHVCHKVARCSL